MSTSPIPSRRQFLGTASAALGAALLPHALISAEAKSPAAVPPIAAKRGNPFTYQFGIGECEAWSISDGHMLFREGLNLMWPDTARDAMRADLVAHSERTDALPLYVNILVVKLGTTAPPWLRAETKPKALRTEKVKSGVGSNGGDAS